MIYIQLFYEFFKTGLFAVGGGLATLPFLRDMAAKTKWFTESALADMIAISESTPGPIGVNMATHAGFQTAGFLGALVATLGLITPAILVILLVARFLDRFKDNRYVNATFYGLRPAVAGLIGAAGITVAKTSLVHWPYSGSIFTFLDFPSIIIFVLVFILLRTFKKHPIWYLFASGIAGIIIGYL
ncbi:MAG: chromate transporter [Ruminococcaceae bacterium]|nr:chromate transporter [Oscillospiraceae bacterium]